MAIESRCRKGSHGCFSWLQLSEPVSANINIDPADAPSVANFPAPAEPILCTGSGRLWTLTSSKCLTPMWTPPHCMRPKSYMSPKMSNLPLPLTLEMDSIITLCTYLTSPKVHTTPQREIFPSIQIFMNNCNRKEREKKSIDSSIARNYSCKETKTPTTTSRFTKSKILTSRAYTEGCEWLLVQRQVRSDKARRKAEEREASKE